MKILKFSAEWCGPCKALAQTISSLEATRVEIEEVDIDKDTQKLTQTFKVRGVPTLIALDDSGNELSRKVGSLTVSQYNEWIGSL